MKKFKKIILTVFTLILLCAGSLLGGAYYYLQKFDTETIDITNINVSDNEEIEDIINIALFGIDSRKIDSDSRSDAVIIVSINTDSKKIRLTSIMRDTLVDIPGYGKDKITHAYAYGGPELAVSTLNSNFDLNITNYATANFFTLADIVDKLGGFEVILKNGEPTAMNKAINEINRIDNLPYGTDYVNFTNEPVLLNGRQTVSYARIRKTGNGDYERTERQRRVLEYCINSIQELPLKDSIELVSEVLPLIKTNLSSNEILSIGAKVLSLGKFEVEQLRIPVDGSFTTGSHRGMWVIEPDLEQNTMSLHEFIK